MGADAKAAWVRGLKQDNKVDFLAIQETQIDDVSSALSSKFWGSSKFQSEESVGATGRSGGLLCIWDPQTFRMHGVSKHRHFLLIHGILKGNNQALNVINVYAPHNNSEKKVLRNNIREIISAGSGQWVLLGDFNAVRGPDDRRNTGFNRVCAHDFNEFIDSVDLVEYNMRDRKYTFLASNSNKLSKIDRVLVCRNFFDVWPDACLRALPRLLSDHCPLLLETVKRNFGPKPFRFFNSWLEKEGFAEMVDNAVASYVKEGANPDVVLTKKFKHLRNCIKLWRSNLVSKEKKDFERDKEELDKLDQIAENRDLEEEEVWIKEECLNNIRVRKYLIALDIKQKSRCRWAVEGEENMSFFHRLINNHRKKNGILGLNVGGHWTSNPRHNYRGEFGRRRFNAEPIDGCMCACQPNT
ncbi:uncharacterized protein LOC110931417 [Helianthus annuus]|uniref:uncharacterized protein LOC110931417 n=1 Tax=Helianthus annuus TaxID=4232 RepID=UPI000B8F16B4|nr:uncharacterized protein LOC110931417 [Helianthus annuus]